MEEDINNKKMKKEEEKTGTKIVEKAVDKKDSTAPKSPKVTKSNLIKNDKNKSKDDINNREDLGDINKLAEKPSEAGFGAGGGVVDDKKKDSKSDKKDKTKKDVVKAPKKTEVKVTGRDLRVSTKQAVAICKFLRNKDVDRAITEMEEVVKMKRAIPMRGEIPHRKGKGMMSGRFPVKASLEFIRLLKSVKANAINHEVDLEKVKVVGMANVASRPRRRGGREQFKRSHVEIKLVPRVKFKKKMKNNNNNKNNKGVGE